MGGVLSQQASIPRQTKRNPSLDLLKTVVLEGRLNAGADAMFCQRETCQQVVDRGGDYLFVVKDNQPELKAAIEAEFRPSFSPLPSSNWEQLLSEARSSSKGHG